MSKVVSMRLKPELWERLQGMARRLGRTPSETSALLLDEGLRSAEFGLVQFRDSPVGRQAYVHGTTLAVWEVVFLARCFANDAPALAEHLNWPVDKVMAALTYAAAYPNEIEVAIADNQRGPEPLRRLLPGLETMSVDES